MNQMKATQIKIYKMDCWPHLRCVWSGAGVLDLKEYMAELLANDLAAIRPILRVTADISNLCLAVEKFFGLQANYVKVGL